MSSNLGLVSDPVYKSAYSSKNLCRFADSQEMLTFRQQIPAFFGDLNRDVDVSSKIYVGWAQNMSKTLKMLTFRQHLRSYPFFRLEMLTFGQDLTGASASIEV